MPVEKTDAVRQKCAEHTRRWRERLRRGAAIYPVEVDGATFDMMERYAGLSPDKISDKLAVRAALGRLLRAGLTALRELEALRRR